NRIYRYSQEADSLELYLSFNGLNFPNGITSDDQNQFLFISTSEGIVRVDISGKHYALLEAAQQINAKQIDGLSYYKNSLIGHQSVKISRFYLTTDRSRIERVELLDSGPEFDSTTTGELDNNFYVYIVNSQIQSGVDYGKRAAKPFDSLENIIIRRIQL
ncbi:MAG: hypothetical protein KDD94_05195, partial [Calditrichaeota bacterium]|nr:hypothetical protein [Calditrichota bacterium]